MHRNRQKPRPTLIITVMDNQLETTKDTTPTKRAKRLKPKQQLALDYWMNSDSDTFGNLYKSCLKAGFRPSYALNIANLNPSWLSENIDLQLLNPEHIKQGVQRIATGDINSRSVDDTRLKAYELLGRYAGMDNNKQTTNVTLVQPILAGASYKPTTTVNSDVIDQSPEPEKSPEK